MKIWALLDKCLSLLSKGFVAAAGLGVAIMTLLIFFDVIGRYIFNSPLPSVYEISGAFILPCTIFLGLAAAGHIRVTMLLERMKGKARLMSELFYLLVTIVFTALLTWQATLSAMTSIKVRETAEAIIAFPIYPARIVVVLGILLYCLVLVASFIKTIKEGKVTNG